MREGSPPLAEALDGFLDDLRIAGQASTARTYGSLLRHVRPHDALTPALCRDIIRNVVLTRSGATADTTWAALASFARWCVLSGFLQASPMAGIPVPRRTPKPHRFLSRDELGKVYQACADDRERLIVRLLLHGLRAGQLLALQWRDLNGDALTIRAHKRNPVHVVALDAETVRLVMALPHLPENGVTLFPLSYERLRVIVTRLGRRAKVPGVHCHAFRHSFASLWMLEVGDAATLQQLGGWSDQRMITSVYARSAMQEAALRRSRAAGMVGKLLDPS